MHYKNGREAKIGDLVIGTTYNRPGVQAGVLVGITPGVDTCNCRVAVLDRFTLADAWPSNRAGVMHCEAMNMLLSPTVDYSACGNLWHAEDALRISELSSTPAVESPS
jgi:hypothetical protein